MTVDLSQLLARFGINNVPAQHFVGLTLDSRKVQQGDVFVAQRGHMVDGRKYIESAINQGAVAIIEQVDEASEHGRLRWLDAVPCVGFYALEAQLSALAHHYYFPQGCPLTLVGVTGTNGKSSVTVMIASLAQACGVRAAVMGTLGNGALGALQESVNTTSDAITVQRQLAAFAAQGIELVAMEVSSHGLVQGRVNAVPFTLAAFTNLTQDHLDFHHTMQAYGQAKQQLFEFTSLAHRIINIDDAFGQYLHQYYDKAQSVSIEHMNADIAMSELAFANHGIQGMAHCHGQTHAWHSPLLGRFNASNIALALASCLALGFDKSKLIGALAQLNGVPGRMEAMSRAGITAVVDYAHTPDALEKALEASRLHCQGELVCIYGCGGDRDRGKRPLMARVAERLADVCIITDDNPRSENPQAIVADMLAGLAQPERTRVIHHRAEAIDYAICHAKAGDLILIAGKGHENYQIIGDQRMTSDDRLLAKASLEAVL